MSEGLRFRPRCREAGRRTTAAALLVLCLCLSGCASVPFSTMARMSTFTERDFAALDAEVVRVRITLPEAFALDVGKSWLGVELTSAAGAHQSTFELDQEHVQTGVIPGIFSRSQRGIVYVLRLSAPSQAKFRDLQRFMGRGRADQVSIRVVPRLASFPTNAASVKVWIDLLLSKTQDYFTLVDGATVDLQKLRAPGAGS